MVQGHKLRHQIGNLWIVHRAVVPVGMASGVAYLPSLLTGSKDIRNRQPVGRNETRGAVNCMIVAVSTVIIALHAALLARRLTLAEKLNNQIYKNKYYEAL